LSLDSDTTRTRRGSHVGRGEGEGEEVVELGSLSGSSGRTTGAEPGAMSSVEEGDQDIKEAAASGTHDREAAAGPGSGGVGGGGVNELTEDMGGAIRAVVEMALHQHLTREDFIQKVHERTARELLYPFDIYMYIHFFKCLCLLGFVFLNP